MHYTPPVDVEIKFYMITCFAWEIIDLTESNDNKEIHLQDRFTAVFLILFGLFLMFLSRVVRIVGISVS